MDKTKIELIRARCDAATPGPWIVGDGTPQAFNTGWDTVVAPDNRLIAARAVYNYHNPTEFDEQTRKDFEFIANARQDILEALDALEAETARADRHEARLEISPYGDDKIDELESAIGFVRNSLESAEKDRDRWKAECEEMGRAYNAVAGSGFTTERINKLATAEREGRLVILPCKVGDTVYIADCLREHAVVIEAAVSKFLLERPWKDVDEAPVTRFVSFISLYDEYHSFPACQLGKPPFFFSREEAEAAIDAAKGGGI
jgi:hypothetical protein